MTYTPDTAHIRSGWVYGAREIYIQPEDAGPMFDRWLARHDAEAQIKALSEIRIVCPRHSMPDCSPLLNGCSYPVVIRNQLNDAMRKILEELDA